MFADSLGEAGPQELDDLLIAASEDLSGAPEAERVAEGGHRGSPGSSAWTIGSILLRVCEHLRPLNGPDLSMALLATTADQDEETRSQSIGR